ncbi:hypothetical protein AVEN_206860-1, partial [Araneus ventricosus]
MELVILHCGQITRTTLVLRLPDKKFHATPTGRRLILGIKFNVHQTTIHIESLMESCSESWRSVEPGTIRFQ